MTRQEKIREWLAELEHAQWQHWTRVRNPEHPLLDVHYTQLTEEQKDQDRVWADKVLNYLHSQGVVLKVDKELPELPMSFRDYDGYEHCREDMADHVAVESLIKEN